MQTRLSLSVDERIPAMLAELAGGQRRMGTYLTHLIEAAHAGQVSVGEVGELEMLMSAVKHLSAKAKEFDGRLQQVEGQR